MTNVHLGNYGVNKKEVESNTIKVEGMVCRDNADFHSRPDSEFSLQDYFDRDNKIIVSGVDTRALVRHIRKQGAMKAVLSSENLSTKELKAKILKVPDMEGLELVYNVSTDKVQIFGEGNAYKLAMIDLGVKLNIIRNFVNREVETHLFPYQTSFEEMMKINPDGFMLTNGPGDPATLLGVVDTAKQILDSNIPTFGICLGHQVLAQAAGLTTYKMHNGHRGINHPILNLETGVCEITSQNHGFAIDRQSTEKAGNVKITHTHLNDHTVAGIRFTDKPCFSVQYHPESSPGPHDSRYLFDEFIQEIKKNKK